MPSRDGYGLSEGRSRCDKKTAKGNTSGNALSFHWRKAIDEVDKEERSSVLRIWQPDHRWVWTDRRSRPITKMLRPIYQLRKIRFERNARAW